jgi:hypothetical protein
MGLSDDELILLTNCLEDNLTEWKSDLLVIAFTTFSCLCSHNAILKPREVCRWSENLNLKTNPK